MKEIEVGGMLGLEDHPEEEEDEAADAGDAVDGEEQVFADGPHLAYITAAAATVRKYGGGCSAAAARAPTVGRSCFRFPFLRRLRRRRYRHCLRRNRRIYVLKIKALRLLLNARIPSLRAVENDDYHRTVHSDWTTGEEADGGCPASVPQPSAWIHGKNAPTRESGDHLRPPDRKKFCMI